MTVHNHAPAYAELVAAHRNLAASYYRAGIFSVGLRVLECGDQLLRAARAGDVAPANNGILALALGTLHTHRAFQWHRGFDSVNIALERANELAESAGDPGLLADVLDAFGLARYYQILLTGAGSYEGPRDDFREALARREHLGDTRGMAESAFHAGLATERTGEVATARALYEQARDLAELHGHRLELSYAARHLGGLAADAGDLDAALALFEQSLELREQVGYTVLLPAAHEAVGDVLLARGDVGGAEEQYRQACDLALAMETPFSQVTALSTLTALLRRSGRAGEAQQYTERAQAIATASGVRLPDSR